MSLVASGKIAPSELVERLIQLESRALEEQPFGALLLVVRAPEDDDSGRFMSDLVDCVKKETPTHSGSQAWLSTTEFPTMPVRGESSEADQVELLSELASAPHCIVPLRGAGRLLRVGRSGNSEIILTDPSVSGSHAEISILDGGVRIEDLSSKNGTSLNGRPLVEGTASWLQPMDRISFGRIESFACDPRALRGVLRQDLRTLL